MTRIFFFLLGFGLTVLGFVYIISYLNLLTIGYNFLEYVKFISGRLECYYSVLGIAMMFITIFMKRRNLYELHL